MSPVTGVTLGLTQKSTKSGFMATVHTNFAHCLHGYYTFTDESMQVAAQTQSISH